MPDRADPVEERTAIRTDLGAIFVSMELSRSSWLITSMSPGNGEKRSKHAVRGGDVAGLLARFACLNEKALARTGRRFPIIVIQEAGLDGFWIHRLLQAEGIESHVVDPASIAVSRRRRRAKTDRLDGETLVRALLAYKRGEPRVCAMVRAPSPEEEDRRRIARERMVLTRERVQHVNRIKGLLFAQGITGYEPLRRNRRWASAAGAPQGPGQPRTGPARTASRADQVSGNGAGRATGCGPKRGDTCPGGDVAQRERHRAGVRWPSLVGGTVPALRQSTASRILRRPGADPLAERVG